MQRNPELAHKVGQMPEIEKLRHEAINKLTSASMMGQMLTRYTRGDHNDPVKELEVEVRLNELLDDAGYAFRKYARTKILKYEQELHQRISEQLTEISDQQDTIDLRDATIERGNVRIRQHQRDLNDLANERGIE